MSSNQPQTNAKNYQRVLGTHASRGISLTLSVDYSGSGSRRSHVSNCHVLSDGRYRVDQSASTEIFDGTTRWSISKTHGPVLRSGPRAMLFHDMLNPRQIIDANECESPRRVSHDGRDALAVEIRSTFATQAEQNRQHLIIDAEWGVAMLWQDDYTGREVRISDLDWDPPVDEAAFRFDPETWQTIVDVRFI